MDRKEFAVVFAGQRDRMLVAIIVRYYRMAEKNVTHAQATRPCRGVAI